MKFYITTGCGVCSDPLVSFDRALQSAKLGNYNLVRISSILPPYSSRAVAVDVAQGSFLHTAYAVKQSSKIGQKIFSTIAVGVPVEGDKIGVIMEYSGEGSAEDAFPHVQEMVRLSMEDRGIAIREIVYDGIDAIVQNEDVMTVFAAISLF